MGSRSAKDKNSSHRSAKLGWNHCMVRFGELSEVIIHSIYASTSFCNRIIPVVPAYDSESSIIFSR